MLQIRPTFSESWYRVASLRARLRTSAQISRQFYRGEQWYVVRDPAGNQFHRLSDVAYRFIGLLDGTRTVEQAWDICGGQLADDAPTQPEIIQILSHLYSANLIEADVTPDATVLLRRHKQLTKRKMQNRLMNVLFPRIPLWDPDSFLCRWMPVVGKILSWVGAVVWCVVVICALALVLPQWQALQEGAHNAMDPANWPWLWAVFVVIKLIHELGHAFACRRFGGECHELGIMFLVFIPTPYVDASAAWGFPSRWQRIFVGAAGMIFELFFAAILGIVWVLIDHKSLGGMLAYNAMLIASVSTLMFNANPLLRYDGYYILSDFLEIPNLRQKSSEYAMGLIKRHVFGVKASQPLPPPLQRFWLLIYAVASSIYRIFVGFVIVLVVAYKIPILGTLMAIGGVATWLFVPVGKLLKYLLLDPELHRKRVRASLFCGAVAALAVVCIGMLNFWVYVEGQGVAEPLSRQMVHVKTPGFVKTVLAKDGQNILAGTPILILSDPKIESAVKQSQAKLDQVNAEIRAYASDNPVREQMALQQRESVQSQLNDAKRQLEELTIRAPQDGILVAPHLSEMPGGYAQRGQEVAQVAVVDTLVVRTVVEQEDYQLVNEQRDKLMTDTVGPDSLVQVRLTGEIGNTQPAITKVFISTAQDTVPYSALLHTGGGTIAPDPSDPKGERPAERQFEVRIALANPQGKFYAGQRAYVRFRLEQKPLIWNWYRKLLQLLRSHENDSKLT